MRQDSLGISNPGVARDQQRAGSRFLRKLNARDDTPGGGSFTQIATDDDEIVPYTRCFPKSQRRTENITFQDHNAGLPITRQNIHNAPFARKLVFGALGNPGPRTRHAPSPGRLKRGIEPTRSRGAAGDGLRWRPGENQVRKIGAGCVGRCLILQPHFARP